MTGHLKTSARPRNSAIDAIRFIAFCAIVSVHMISPGQLDHVQFPWLVNAFGRFAVPCFFMISGYFIPDTIEKPFHFLFKQFLRLAPVFIVWELLYIGIDSFVFPIADPVIAKDNLLKFLALTLYNGGVAFHLWFLPWLFVCLCVFVLVRQVAGFKGVVFVSALLYLIGLCLGPYHEVLGLTGLVEHISNHPENYTARSGPFFGVLFLCLGNLFARIQIKATNAQLAMIACSGFILHLGEALLIAARDTNVNLNIDFMVSTILFGASSFLFLMRINWGAATQVMGDLGQKTLGLFCLHALFVMLINKLFGESLPYEGLTAILTRAALAVLVIGLSVITISVLYKFKSLRRFIA